MKAGKHTPGPWSVVADWMKSPKVVDAAGQGICHTTYAPTNAEANARLIAQRQHTTTGLKLLLPTKKQWSAATILKPCCTTLKRRACSAWLSPKPQTFNSTNRLPHKR